MKPGKRPRFLDLMLSFGRAKLRAGPHAGITSNCNSMSIQAPSYARTAHAALHLLDVSPTGEFLVNEELLLHSRNESPFAPSVLDKTVDHILSSLAATYFLPNPAAELTAQPMSIYIGPCIRTVRAVCVQIAYTPDNTLTAREAAHAYAGSIVTFSERAEHIGASPVRLAAFAQWMIESGLSAADLQMAQAAFGLFIQSELEQIAASIYAAAAAFDVPLINAETFLAKRSAQNWAF